MPAYIIITKEKTRDAEALSRYVAHHEEFIAGHALTYRARFGRCETVEGATADGAAILEFPTFAEAKAWYASEPYQRASRDRYLGGDFRFVIVEGV
jgi:uncharacterized protein (DUF1330 family)